MARARCAIGLQGLTSRELRSGSGSARKGAAARYIDRIGRAANATKGKIKCECS